MSFSTRFTTSRPAVAALVFAALLPTVQARCYFDDDDDDYNCGLSNGARVGIAVGVATFVFILVFLLIMNQRRRSSAQPASYAPDAGALPPLQGPPPTFYAPPIPPPVALSFAPPQNGYAAHGTPDNGAQFAPPAGPPPGHARNASGSGDLPPAYLAPPPGSPMAQLADKAYSGVNAKAENQV